MPRPDQQEPVVFELVEGDGPDAAGTAGAGGHGGDGPGDADPDGAPGPRAPRLPRLSRRTRLVALAAVAAVVLGSAAVDLVRDHRRADLMRTSPVGVASLADPPERRWTMRFDVAAPRADEGFVDQQLVTMDGLLVVPPAAAQSYTQDVFTGSVRAGFRDVVAVDPGSGEVAWRVPVDENPVCGPSGYDASMSVDALVCVQGTEDAREVLTIAPDGSTRSRSADLADGEQVFPGPDGLLVRVERATRLGEDVTEVRCNGLGTCTPSVLKEGRDVRVVAEDAATGAERWTTTVGFTPVETVNCQQAVEDGEAVVDADQVSVYSGAESVTVEGCGVRSTLSAQGARLDRRQDADDIADGDLLSHAWVTELGRGLFAVETGSMETVVVDAGGEVVRTLNGWVRTGMWAPDAPHDLWFVTTRSAGYGFDAVREDGSVAWSDPNSQGILLVGRDVVVADRGGQVVGLDRETGEQVWVWEGGDTAGMSRYRTVTDGDTVAMVHLPQAGHPGAEVVALDLGTGEEQWAAPVPGSTVAVDGNLVAINGNGLTGLG